VVTALVFLVTIRIGPHLVVTTLVTGPLATQIVTVTIGRTANRILVTNTETGVVPLTVTEHKRILVTVSLGKIILVTVNKIRVTTGLAAMVVTGLQALLEIVSQVSIAPLIISLQVTNSVQSV
jgi:hypothetical protein